MTTGDCDRMVAAARRAGRQLLVGHVLPFFPEYAWALGEIRSGRHGRLRGGYFRRVVAEPTWMRDYWDAAQMGGPMLDLHIHDAHFIRLVFGMPTAVTTRGSERHGLPEYWHSLFEFADRDVTVAATSGVIASAARPFLHGFEIHLERATLVFEFGVFKDPAGGEAGRYLCPPKLLGADGNAHRVELGDGDPMHAFAAELAHVVRVIAGQAEPDALAGDLARDAVALCHLQSDSLHARKRGLAAKRRKSRRRWSVARSGVARSLDRTGRCHLADVFG